MPIVDFLPFATGAGAEVEPQANWTDDAAVIDGFVTGIANNLQVNKAIRQPSFIAAALAHYVAQITNQNVLDDGNLNEFLVNFWQATLGAGYFVDQGAVNALVVAAPSGLTFPPPFAGLQVRVKAAVGNTGSGITFDWMGTGAVPVLYGDGTPINPKDIGAGQQVVLWFNGTNWLLVSYTPTSINNIVATEGHLFATRTRAISSDYAVVPADAGTIFWAGAAITVTLPAASTMTNLTIGLVCGNPVTLAISGGGSLLGGVHTNATSILLPTLGFISVQSDGTNWRILAADASTAGAPGDLDVLGSGHVSGALTVGGVSMLNGVRSTSDDFGGNGGQFRAVAGGYGAFFRNDGNQAYWLSTPAGSPNGTWNGFRPFAWNLSSGVVQIDMSGAGTTIAGTVTAGQDVNVSNTIRWGTGDGAGGNCYLSYGGGYTTLNFWPGFYAQANPGQGWGGFFVPNANIQMFTNGDLYLNANAVIASNLLQANYMRESAGARGSGDGARVVNLNDFWPWSFGNNGYVTLPNGLIIQWGSTPNPPWENGTAFPTAFPHACLNVTACEGSVGGWYQFSPQGGCTVYGTTILGAWGFAIGGAWIYNGGTVRFTSGDDCSWIAIGW